MADIADQQHDVRRLMRLALLYERIYVLANTAHNKLDFIEYTDHNRIHSSINAEHGFQWSRIAMIASKNAWEQISILLASHPHAPPNVASSLLNDQSEFQDAVNDAVLCNAAMQTVSTDQP